ncbi:MAG: hypothetical protein IPM98_17885 [Lewinellaceae bacterium]|nr:hypothetical protein [Lewinellaceae bacterium]
MHSSRNDLEIYQTELVLAETNTLTRFAKPQSDKYGTLSEKFDAQGSVNKLRIERENYSRRSSFTIVKPQDGYVVKARPGIGEFVQEGDPVVSILPADYQLAVELCQSHGLAADQPRQADALLVDGWPAFFFSGWPGFPRYFCRKCSGLSTATSEWRKFRVLVEPDQNEQTWPVAKRIGGARESHCSKRSGMVEFWRILNGFPPDLYQDGGR